MKKFWKLAATAAAASLIVAACGGSESGSDTTDAKGDLKVAIVYVGTAKDKGWTYQHDQGIIALEKELGVKVKRIEFVKDDDGSSEAVFEELADEGYNLIFANSFGYGEQMALVAEKNPDICMQWATGDRFLLTKGYDKKLKWADDAALPQNLGTYFGAAEEARYLSGIAAGNATRNGKIGYVAAYAIPEVLRGINAFTLGVRSVKPEATVQVTWTKTWYNPSIEKQAAEALLDTGVDVIAQHQDTTEAGVAAEAKGAKWVGYNSDTPDAAPNAWLTAPTWDWSGYYINTAKEWANGTCSKEPFYGTMKDGTVTLGSFGPGVDAATQTLINEKKAAIIAGTFAPFTGPINKQDGSEWLKAGETADLGFLLGDMTFFVEGVDGNAEG
jgi:basic membrane protein A